jgi:GT2 family glycosyltransferase
MRRRVLRRVAGSRRSQKSSPGSRAARRLVEAGLIDVEWYRIQRPSTPDDPIAVATHYLRRGRKLGLSPNPLFSPARARPGSWQSSSTDPLLDALRRRRMRSPHPLFDPRAWLESHPEAAEHRGGALGHFLEHAGPDTVMPAAKDGPQGLRWGRARELLVAGLTRVVAQRRLDLSRISRTWDQELEDAWRRDLGAPPEPPPGRPLVSVVMPVRDRADGVADAIGSVRAQTAPSWELIVVDDGSTDGTPEVVEAIAAVDERVRLVRNEPGGVSRARNTAIELARGRYVAFLDSDNAWDPDYLRLMSAAMTRDGVRVAHSAIRGTRDGRTWYRLASGGVEELMVDNFIDMNALMVEAELLDEVGGFDESLRRMVDWDLAIRLAQRSRPVLMPFIGVEYDDDREGRDRITTTELRSWREFIISKHTIDWAAEQARSRVPGRVSVVIPTYDDWRMTVRAVRSVLAHSDGIDVEVVVLDNGSGSMVHQMLTVALTDRPRVVLVRRPKNVQFALGSNLGFVASTGEFTLFLNNDTRVEAGWLPPLLAELEQPGVVGVQPLLLYPDGTVQCAGVVFPERAGLPVHFLAHHPVEDAILRPRFATHAVTAAAVLMRSSDVARLRGFDPLYSNGLEDVDLCLRAGGAEDRVFRVVTGSRVVHLESKTSGRWERVPDNRMLFMDRWRHRMPTGPEPLWGEVGLDVVAQVPVAVVPDPDPRVPQLYRPFLLRRHASEDALRWAIKIGAPYGPKGDIWGDVHFASALARSLRRLGQEVVIDRVGAHQRPTCYLDDVVLNLRGLEDVAAQPGRVNLMWVISHPDLVTPAEIARYDRVFAASAVWSSAMSAASGDHVEPLLQATDPTLFHPDRGAPDSGHQALFVGSSRGVHRPIVRHACEAELDLVVHGPHWEQFLPDADFVHGPVPNDQVGELYATSGVVLNDHWSDMAEHGFLSNRLFDVVASGGRVITDHVEGLDQLFEGAAQVYRDVDDLRFLAGPGRDQRFPSVEERRRIAERVGREHSFDARARRLLDVAHELR